MLVLELYKLLTVVLLRSIGRATILLTYVPGENVGDGQEPYKLLTAVLLRRIGLRLRLFGLNFSFWLSACKSQKLLNMCFWL